MPTGYELHQWTPDEVSKFWDFAAKNRPAYFGEQVGSNLVNRYRNQVRSANAILDYGCGSGHLLEEAAAVGSASLRGLEFSDDSAAAVEMRLKDNDAFEGVITSGEILKFAESFDLVFCLEVIEHLDDASLKQVLESIHSLLVPGGHLIITTPNDEDLSQQWLYHPAIGGVIHRWQHVRSFTSDTLTATLESTGYSEVGTETLNLSNVGWSPVAIAKRALGSLQGRKPPHLIALCVKDGSPVELVD